MTSPADELTTTMDAVNFLIQRHRKRRALISDLLLDFRRRIRTAEADVARDMRKQRITDLSEVRKSSRIERNLHVIQQRWRYVQDLENKQDGLDRGIEEMRYQLRLARIDRELGSAIDHLTPAVLANRLKAVLQQHQDFESRLSEPTRATPPELPVIWGRVRESREALAGIRHSDEERLNEDIWEEIRGGCYLRAGQLTALSAEAAESLSRCKGKDLFLGNLRSLSPGAARCLARWKGSWLVLNGLSELSPEAAAYLSSWGGSVLSLNGLEALSPEAVTALSRWKGRQIELAGLKRLGALGRRGVKLYLPERWRKTYEDLLSAPEL